jgi:hypothetical protein
MNNDLNHVVVTNTNFEYLCDIEVIMGLMCIKPMLKALCALIKFAHACDTFVCDFVTNVKLCCVKLYKLFFDMETKYGEEHFKTFLDLHDSSNDQLLVTWWTNSTKNIQYAIFYL